MIKLLNVMMNEHVQVSSDFTQWLGVLVPLHKRAICTKSVCQS